jgi:acetyltransferase-like isoleucine patch superfamily enzyme
MVYFKNYINWLLRVNYYKKILINSNSKITSYQNFKVLGNNFDLHKCLNVNSGIYIQCSNGVQIHSSCIIASGSKLISGNHDLYNFKKESLKASPIIIKENCWIAANAIILPSVILEKRTIVGAGAVVTKSFNEENIVLAGNPAKIISKL